MSGVKVLAIAGVPLVALQSGAHTLADELGD